VALTQPHAISGLGGIGKTQTAVEYAYRYRAEYTAVLWTRADFHKSLVSDFVALAALLNLPEQEEADQGRVVEAVKRWLQAHSRWLLVLDNADDLEMVYDFLPLRGRGHILLTSRAQATGPAIKGIALDMMGREEGALLLLRRAKLLGEDAPLEYASEQDRSEAETTCEMLDGLPLALDQAAAYVEENQCRFADYLALYQTRPDCTLESTRFPESERLSQIGGDDMVAVL
jgi:NB-ARC domain